MIGPFQFCKLDDSILITNDMGFYEFLTPDEFLLFANDGLDTDSSLYSTLYAKYFVFNSSREQYLERTKYPLRYGKSYLFQATNLHIFVVTNECNGECLYCQAQSGRKHSNRMDKKTAQKAVEFALQSPAKQMTFEFQGGEPLLNFPIIKYIIEYTEAHKRDKEIQYSLVSNLSLLTEEIAEYIKEKKVAISTSLDGGKELHSYNRPLRNGQNSYDVLQKKLALLRALCIRYGAIETTTRASLQESKSIVEAYINLGIETLFLRPLTPLGNAAKAWDTIGYSPEEFVEFYENSIDRIIKKNKEGRIIREGNAMIFLSKILCGQGINYMELRSPCGAVIGQMAYYFDGNIYSCDEGRMLSEMGDRSFQIGNVFTDDYNSVLNGKRSKVLCKYSILEDLPKCCDCVYQPYCGTCPVVNYALEKDIISKSSRGYRCRIYKGMLKTLFKHLKNPEDYRILEAWVQ